MLCHYPAVTTVRGTCKKPGCKGKMTKEDVLYFILNASDNCTKCTILFSNIQNQNKNYIALFLHGHWPKGPFSPVMIPVPCPPREPYGPLLSFHSLNGFSTKILNIWFLLIPTINNKNHIYFSQK